MYKTVNVNTWKGGGRVSGWEHSVKGMELNGGSFDLSRYKVCDQNEAIRYVETLGVLSWLEAGVGKKDYIPLDDSAFRQFKEDLRMYTDPRIDDSLIIPWTEAAMKGERVPFPEPRKLAIGVDKRSYEDWITSSYYKGVMAIPNAVFRYYKPRRKPNKTVKKASGHFSKNYPELREFKHFIADNMLQIVNQNVQDTFFTKTKKYMQKKFSELTKK